MQWLSGGEPIARVCAECGFASTAAFSRAFRQVTGLTPTAFLNPSIDAGQKRPRSALPMKPVLLA